MYRAREREANQGVVGQGRLRRRGRDLVLGGTTHDDRLLRLDEIRLCYARLLLLDSLDTGTVNELEEVCAGHARGVPKVDEG